MGAIASTLMNIVDLLFVKGPDEIMALACGFERESGAQYESLAATEWQVVKETQPRSDPSHSPACYESSLGVGSKFKATGEEEFAGVRMLRRVDGQYIEAK